MQKSMKRVLVFLLICLCSIGFISCSCMTKPIYTVSFMVGDEVVTTQTIEKGGVANEPETPTKEGYTFMDWYADEAYTVVYDFSAPVNDNISVYAYFLANYKATFIVEGEAIGTQSVERGKTATEPVAPTKEGYAFMGWYTDETYATAFDFTAPLSGDVSIYAYFLENYTASFIVDGEVYETQSIGHGATATEPVEAPTKEGYAFMGWYTDETYATAFDFTAPLDGDVSIYAYFEELHTVSFIVDGEVYETQSIVNGETATEPAEAPEKDYFVFKRWCVNADGSFAFDFETPIFEDTNVYASLAAAYKITYIDAADNSVLLNQFVEEGMAPVRPNGIEKEGYKVRACYYDEELTNEYVFDVALDDGTALYVVYEEIVKIYTANALREIANRPDGFYRLAADINLEGEAWTPIADFTGEIDGYGYTISQFTMTTTSTVSGFVETNNGVLKNITIEHIVVNASTTGTTFNAGALVGVNNGTIENCTVSDAVVTYKVNCTAEGKGSYDYQMGGMVGYNYGEMSDCKIDCVINANTTVKSNGAGGYHQATVKSYMCIGGMVGANEGVINSSFANVGIDNIITVSGKINYTFEGYAKGYACVGGFARSNDGTIKDCGVNYSIKTAYTVKKYGSAYSHIGGFIQNNNGEINRCFAKGVINEQGSDASQVTIGGFVERNTSIVKDCYAENEINCVSAKSYIGGFAYTSSKTISSSYTVSKITADTAVTIGGFIGENAANNTVSASFASTEITYTSATNVGAFAGTTASGSYFEKCYYNSDCKIMQGEMEVVYEETNANISALSGAELYSTATVYDTLWWNKDIWSADGVNAPKLCWELY